MFFISLFMLVFFVCTNAIAISTEPMPHYQGHYSFNDLSSAVQRLLKNEELALALQSLQKTLEEQDVPQSVLERKINSVKIHLPAASLIESNQRAILKARKEKECTEKIKLLAKIRTELGRLELDYQEKAAEKALEEAPASVCSTVTVITSVPYAITLPGHYCLGSDFSNQTTPFITITASDVDLSLDTHSLDTGTVGVLVENATNVKISGMGTVSNVQVGVLIENCEYVIVGDTAFQANSNSAIASVSSEMVVVKNCFFDADAIGVYSVSSAGLKIYNSYFTGCTAGVTLDGGSTGISVSNCYFDKNVQDIVRAVTTPGDVIGVSVDACFMSNASQGNSIDLTSVTEFSISNTLISDVTSGSSLSITDSTDSKISHCQMLSPSVHGISLQGSNQNVLVRDCMVLNAQMSGVTAQGMAEGSFSHSLFAPLSSSSCSALNFSQCESVLVSQCVCSAIAQDPDTAGTNGVVFDGCTGFSLTDCQVETNARSQDASSGSALLISNGCVGGDIQRCTFGSTQPNVANFAIFAQGDNHSLRFIDNTIDGAYRSGLRLDGTKFSQVSNNLIRGVQNGSGITLKKSHGVAVIGNTVMNNDTHGIHLDKEAKHSFVYGNTVYNNKKIGIKNNTDGHVNKIYHNFAKNNREKNYLGVSLVAGPGERVGALENISDEKCF